MPRIKNSKELSEFEFDLISNNSDLVSKYLNNKLEITMFPGSMLITLANFLDDNLEGKYYSITRHSNPMGSEKHLVLYFEKEIDYNMALEWFKSLGIE